MKKFVALLLCIMMLLVMLAGCSSKPYNYDLGPRFQTIPNYKNGGISIEMDDVLSSLESQIQALIDANTSWPFIYNNETDEERGTPPHVINGDKVIFDDAAVFVEKTSMVGEDSDTSPVGLGEYSPSKDPTLSGTKQSHVVGETDLPKYDFGDTQLDSALKEHTLPETTPAPVYQTDTDGSNVTDTNGSYITVPETAPESTSAPDTTIGDTTTDVTTDRPTEYQTDTDGSYVTDTDGSYILVPETTPPTSSELDKYEELASNGEYIKLEITFPSDYMKDDANYTKYRGFKALVFIKVGDVSKKVTPDFKWLIENEKLGASYDKDTLESDYRAKETDKIIKSLGMTALFDAFVVKSVKDGGFPMKELKKEFERTFMYQINYYTEYVLYYGVYLGYTGDDPRYYSYKEFVEQLKKDGMLDGGYDAFVENCAISAATNVKQNMVIYYIERIEGLVLTDALYDYYLNKAIVDINNSNKETEDFTKITNEKELIKYYKDNGYTVGKKDLQASYLSTYLIDLFALGVDGSIPWLKVNPATEKSETPETPDDSTPSDNENGD